MSFLSFNFAIFLGVALLIFHLGAARWRPGLLLGLSYAFYLTWSAVHTLLLAVVTIGVYAAALRIESRRSEQGKRAWMTLGVAALLIVLFAFKCAVWLRTENSTLAALVLVPLGLSYYVFKMVGYLLDVYWETIPAQHDFVAFALFGSFFPQIVSGPIQRAQSFFEQLGKIESPDAGDFVTGLRRILFGLFKKIVVADNLGVVVANIHANPAGFSPLELLAGAYCFAIELYTDFSGLTDMAIGIGLLFGVKGPENFDLPFLATNIQLFWRRWHMSLTTWLTDYLFMPLRMSFRALGTAGLCLAIFINMVAIGLWHGIAWTFLVFGAVNGIFMVVSVLTLKRRNVFFQQRPGLARAREFVAPVLVFHLVAFSLIFFRAGTFSSACTYLAGLVGAGHGNGIPVIRFDLPRKTLLLCAAGYLAIEGATWATRRRFWVDRFLATPALLRRAAYCAMIAAVLFLFKGSVTFIYARF